MTTSVVLANLPTNPVDVSVNRFASGDFKLRSLTISGDQFVGEYIFVGGDPTIETLATYQTAVSGKDGVKRSSLRLRTQQTVTVDSVVTEIAPVDVTVAWNTPGLYEDPTAIMKMIGCAFGLTFGTLSSKVPQNEVVNAINRSTLGAMLT
jgi:hypothetical protein